MRIEQIEFRSRKGHSLSGKLELPAEGKAQHFVLFAHCFTCGKDLSAARNIGRALSAQGFGVLRFDFTGLGRSGGDFADSHFQANIEDLLDAASYLEEHYHAPSVLIGHSLGGAAVIFAAAQLDSVRGVVTIGAPSDPEHVTHLFEDSLDDLEQQGSAQINIAGRSFHIGEEFVSQLQGRDLQSTVKSLRRALLVCHSPQDSIVGVNNAAEIYVAAHHPKSFLSLDGADHLLSRSADSNYVGNMIAAWVTRYIDQPDDELHTDEDVVVSLSEPGFTAKVKAGNHRMIADEPRSVGGLDMGPSPYEFVSTGLAACTAMTIRMYTDRKGWPLDEVNVHVSHGKRHAEDFDHVEDKSSKVDVFERKVEVKGDLDEAQRKRIMQIADKCPVHRTLEASSVIRTEEA